MPGYEDSGKDRDHDSSPDPSRILPEHGYPERSFPGAVICINDSLIRVAKNIKLFKPEMILMVPLMIETMAKKLEEASLLPAKIVKNQVFGKQFHTICSGGAYLDPSYIEMFKKYDITIQQGYGMTECAPVISVSQNGISGRIPWDASPEL